MRSHYLQCALAMLILVLAPRAYGLPGENIVLDPNTGNYTITYFGYDETSASEERTVLRQATFEPATKIEPAVQSNLKIGASGIVAYGYRVHNAPTSRRPLVKISFDSITDIVSTDMFAKQAQGMQSNAIAENYGVASYSINTPQGWSGRAITSRSGGLRVSWSSFKASLPSGAVLNGFGFFSHDLPGIGIVQLQGDSAIREFVDEGPIGEVGDQLRKLVQNDFVPRSAAVPTIVVPVPLDSAIVLDRIRAHVATWPSKQLVNIFAAQLDRYLVTAADAYRFNNAKAGKEHLETLRKMLVKEHHNLDHDDEDEDDLEERKVTTRFTIDRLAARVLDFDLRYVLKRADKNKERD